MTAIITDSAQEIAISLSRIIIKDAITLVKNGKTIASLDAEYDFSSLPKDLHSIALGIAAQKQTLIMIPDLTPEEKEELECRRNKPWWKFW